MASSAPTLDDSFNTGGSIDDVLSCPICLETYKSPKVLPSCGHSFCFQCISKIVHLAHDPTRLCCPECRVVSVLGCNGIYGLRTNIQLQRTVAMYEASTTRDSSPVAAAGSLLFDSFHDKCPHIFLTKSPLSCDHCGTKFCNGCGIAHMEKMKLEMITLTSGFEERLGTASDGVDAWLEKMKGLLNQQFEVAHREINETLNSLEQKITSALARARAKLIEKASEARDAKLAEFSTVFHLGTTPNQELAEKMEVLAQKSVLNCGLEEMAQLYSKVTERDHQIFALEKFRNESLKGKVAFRTDPSWEIDILSVLQRLDNVDLKWQSLGEMENEAIKLATAKIHRSAKTGDLDSLILVLNSSQFSESMKQMLIERTEDVDPPNFLTPLMQASKSGQVEVVKYLLETHKADVRAAIAKRCVSSIHLACQYGRLAVVRYLLGYDGTLVKTRNYSGATPLAYAVHHGNMDVVRFLIEEMNVDVEESGPAGKTPLMEAASKGQLVIVEYLIFRGAGIYARQPKTGNVAVHFAAMAGCLNTVRYFLDRKPDLLIVRNYKGLTLIDMANDQAVINLLEDRGARRRVIPDF